MVESSSKHYLKAGDIVDVVAPSSKCHPSVLEKMRILLQTWELECHIPTDLFGDSLLYANTDVMRFEHLKNALFNPKSKAVWCLLGGFGSTKLIPMLSKMKPPLHSKLFIGFSDITALHIFLQDQWGWSTIHGPSGYQASLNKVSNESINLLKKILFHADPKLKYEQLTPLNKPAEHNTVINAPLIGGNLHLIQASLGTSWQICARNKILFIEEVNERAYRVDRALEHVSQAGILEQIKAILFGDFIDKGEPDGNFLVKDIIYEFASRYSFPVLQIKNVGHGSVNNPILLGSMTKLITGVSSSLEFVSN